MQIAVIFWIVFGALVGWIGAMIDGDSGLKQTWGYIMLGIIGAIIGGLLINIINQAVPLQLGSNNLILPTLCSIIALCIAVQARKQSR